MSRRIISICFSLIFVALITAPTIIALVDDSIDVSVFYASSEEEEKGNEKNEKNKNIEVIFSSLGEGESNYMLSEIENDLEYYYKNYPKPHLNLISPPPELHIL